MSFKSWGPACERCVYGMQDTGEAENVLTIKCRVDPSFNSWHTPFDFCGKGHFLVADPVKFTPPPYSVWTFGMRSLALRKEEDDE